MNAHADLKIYSCFAATPARLLSLVRVLRVIQSPMSAEDVAAWLHPASLRRGEDDGRSPQVAEVIAAACELELLRRTGLGGLELVPELQADACPEDNLASQVVRMASRVAFAPGPPEKPNGFATLSAWWCHQPLFRWPETTEDLQQRLVDQGFELDALKVRNNQRWDMLRYWWQFLGLAANMATGPNRGRLPGVLADATGFLAVHLTSLLPARGTTLGIDAFLDRLGSICPALDGGSVSKAVGEAVHAGPKLTTALSMALLRLEQRGALRAWCPDDQRDFAITQDDRRVALVALLDGGVR